MNNHQKILQRLYTTFINEHERIPTHNEIMQLAKKAKEINLKLYLESQKEKGE